VSPEKVYVALFAESADCPHIHFHLIPRAPDHPVELRGPHVFALMKEAARGGGEGPSLAAIEALALRLRSCLTQDR
jgi:diadenosine tetraphosphate (Ap4A) HIT family hydrolase